MSDWSFISSTQVSDPEKLNYPKYIAPYIGIGVNELCALKRKGCRFFGKKTSVRWVREYLDKVTGVESAPERVEHLQYSDDCKFDGLGSLND